MQSHIGSICLSFLHCVFSNVSSNGLPQRMHSRTGCIYLTFLQCVFSNVSSKRLPEWMHNHIGCICLSFLHCEFSNVSSKHLPERMQSHTGCIFLFALTPKLQQNLAHLIIFVSVVQLPKKLLDLYIYIGSEPYIFKRNFSH